ncbi:transthyretin domain protein (hydroxyisourate hydrolase) [Colletotrichum truncatum]|uniref:Transthyretin domain protein (Hydroxyisourate hydrolase) n=1 Tax=Colletotrichum truncatum TaxID=5467 RepID=A0ACC3ZEG4_COLTU|nr:transthyretin domain protein (hydroxyisourate hydrolase) [Colletotrichum truncatum]KAF6794882.1 transthyretin domain protein (hydroxyisourate hydrolase) [Colletotrichum truncatum]
MATQTKDRITCHVLDTAQGKPARGVRVQLSTTTSSAPSPPGQPAIQKTFESQTDDDGRVKAWLPYSSEDTAGEVPVYTLEDVLGEIRGPSRWTLRFDTAAYFGGDDKTFFPEAVVVFTVQEGQHYHVPLLLSPYSYTTYRGS